MDDRWHKKVKALSVHVAARAKDIIYPPACLVCRESIDGAGQLCTECWRKVHFLDGPACSRCGIPFEFDIGEGSVCAGCLAAPPIYACARSVFLYDEASKALVLSLKHADRIELAPTLAGWMVRSGREILRHGDVLVPVPLHWQRRISRRFNQSAELTRWIATISEKPMSLLALERHKAGPSQGTLRRKARQRNVAGVFRIRESLAHEVEGKRAILVDDVMTTGATANACARAILNAGAAKVDVLTLARVALPGQSTI